MEWDGMGRDGSGYVGMVCHTSVARAVYIVDVNAIASWAKFLVGQVHFAHNWMGFRSALAFGLQP